jgi:hypothetical protein
MQSLSFFFAVLFLLASKTSSSQVTCSKNKLVGDWYYVTSFPRDQRINLDSLKTLVTDTAKLKKTGSYSEDGKYISFSPRIRKGRYRLDETYCCIIYGRRKNPSSAHFNRIRYLDEKWLIIIKTNPHYETTAVFYRK